MAATRASPSVRVLIVDDAAESREMLRRALSMDEEIEVVGEAGSGEEALAQAEALNPDIVLMDVRMPRGNGIDATRKICVRLPDTKVVALTAHEDAGTVRDMLRAGATGYVVKGAPITELVSAVRGAAAGEGQVDDRVLPVALGELKRLLRQERERRQEAERLARMREEFVHVIAHEIRTPLTVIGGALQVLAGGTLGEDEREIVSSARRRAADLERLVEGLELVGEEIPAGAATSPLDAVQDATAELAAPPDVVEVEDETWRGIPRKHLARIAFELLDNALRHGARPVHVRTARDGGEGVLEVRDAGGELPDESLTAAFVQGDMSTTRERGGMGLGLYVAGRLCRGAGGTLRLRLQDGVTVAEARLRLSP